MEPRDEVLDVLNHEPDDAARAFAAAYVRQFAVPPGRDGEREDEVATAYAAGRRSTAA